jgi:hypothetical protein
MTNPEPELFTTFREAERVGAYQLAGRWASWSGPIRSSERTAAYEIDELATMAALRAWLTRWLPIQIHRVLLKGGTLDQAADAADMTPDEVTAAWRTWAAGQRHLRETLPGLKDHSAEYDAVELLLAAAEAARKEGGPTDA